MENHVAPNAQKTPPELPEKKAPWFLRLFLRLTVIFLSLCIGIAVTCFIIVKYYQDDVKEYVVGELNKKLNTQVIIDGKDIDFTILKSFPYASLNFKNVKALDACDFSHKDTLFKAAEISFQFNLIDV